MGANKYIRKPVPLSGEVKPRKCMLCGEEFLSVSRGNRRCKRCLRNEPKTSKREPTGAARHRGRKGKE